MKLLKKIVRVLSASRTNSDDSINKFATPIKRRKTLENSDDIPHQLIDMTTLTKIFELNEQQYNLLKKRALIQLEPILRKCLRMNNKETAKFIDSLKLDSEQHRKPVMLGNIFGCPLDQISSELINTDTQFPLIIVRLMQSFVTRGGFQQEGPFRIEGDKLLLTELVNGISRGVEADGISIDSFPLPVISAAIKRYIRLIPGSLIPKSTTALIVKLYNIKDANLRTLSIQLLLLTLPFQHSKVFTSLNLFLKACSMQKNVHKMSAVALSVCFGPTIFDTGIDIKIVGIVNNLLSEIITEYSHYSKVPSILLQN